MGNWMRLILVVTVALLFHSAGALAQTATTTTRTWTSPNGEHALRVVETLTVNSGSGPRGPICFPKLSTRVTGISISRDGAQSERWQWSPPPPRSSLDDFPVANVLVGDSGKLSAMIRRDHGNPLTVSGEDTGQPQVVILDDKGQSHAAVAAATWWKALGPDGNVSPDNPPKLRFLENEKILEIKLASGKTARVNTDSGELSIEKGAATVPATVPAATAAGGK